MKLWPTVRLLACSATCGVRHVPPRCDSLTPNGTFADEYAAALPDWLIERAAECGFQQPTPVQSEALGAVLEGRDAIVQAKTGSGKVAAFEKKTCTRAAHASERCFGFVCADSSIHAAPHCGIAATSVRAGTRATAHARTCKSGGVGGEAAGCS